MIKETTAMTNELSNLQHQLQEALQLLQESKVFAPEQQRDENRALPATDVFFKEHNSLLDKCAQVCAQYQEQKPTIRIIHHVACSGGTLISKCLSVMPNTYLLSEIHPYTDLHLRRGKPAYTPSDIASLCRHANIPNIRKLHSDLFIKDIKTIHDHVNAYGGNLILRDHTHADIHVGNEASTKASIVNTLAEDFNIHSVLTFRNPIDSFLSLQNNGWNHFNPNTFEEYCARILKMLDIYNTVPIFHYEDFIKAPDLVLADICKTLSIDYDSSWSSIFDIAQVSGDSGRSGNIIAPRSRRELKDDFKQEILDSASFDSIRKKFNY